MEERKTYAIIDIGSNTIRLVLYQWTPPQLIRLLNKKKSVGLAGYRTSDNCLSEEGIVRTIKALQEFQDIIRYVETSVVAVFATASLRNLDNTAEVVERIHKETGFTVRILSGEEEANFDYYGVMQHTPMENGLLLDIGGGSTEFVLFQDKKVLFSHSVPIGSLNLYNQCINGLMPNRSELQSLKKQIRHVLNECCQDISRQSPGSICAVGGSCRAAFHLIEAAWPEAILSDGSYPVKMLRKLLKMYKKDKIAFIHLTLKNAPDRIHTILPGLLILKETADFYGIKSISTSDFGVREGYLYHAVLHWEESLNHEEI